ncbi:hypothetical protein JX265_006514 [Neoarthrinium moseri]|uniref:Peptidase A1 domain-containing protein n=1 Tax=Neoarthrinium moseri TaxID=1658444 RepID=A0A9P9WLP3_9PEZI|nr:hypothetical protein JX266_000208 [Neoarthrinium moseri]KAI1869424.1 hypothetical protein JX265_006514 [Neoarthrinium moseri]
MKSIAFCEFAELLSLLATAQLAVAKKASFAELSLSRSAAPLPSTLKKRQSNLPLTRSFGNETYTVNVDIGNPKQSVKLAVDVGSYVTYVLETCEENYFYIEQCKTFGTYNESLSSSSKYVSSDEAYIDNDDGSSYSLVHYADDLTIQGEDTLKNVTFGVYEYPSAVHSGSLGLGFGRGVNSNHSNVVDELVSQGVMQTKAFGLALGTGHSLNEGSLVLGGVDTKKFAGALQKVPIIDPPKYPFDYEEFRYWMNVDSLTLRNGINESSHPGFKVMTHSMDEVSYLPTKVVNEIASAFGIYNTSDEIDEWYVVPCESKDLVKGSVDLHFGALNVSIPYADFIISSTQLEEIDYETARELCYLSTFPWDDLEVEKDIDFYYLGHPFLRAVYAVYDQDNRAMWLANRNECGSDIKEITKSEDSISGIRGQCDGSGLESSFGSNSTDNNRDAEGLGTRTRASIGALAISMFAWFLMGF